jgi:dihydropteroate synthase
MIYKFKNINYDFSKRTYLMGILNITPDSFSDGGLLFDKKPKAELILETALRMEKEGADFIDIGGESSRPGAETVSIEQELERVISSISEIKSRIKIPVSIDTYKSEVAREALKAGAEIVNDISGFRFDDKMAETVREYNASCILMHIKGTPKNMQLNPEYKDVLEEVKNYLSESCETAQYFGIEQIIIDPGIGFGKTLEHNIKLIQNLDYFKPLGYPVLIGLSNKSFIDKISPASIDERLEGTIASNTVGILNGANILRVHNVLNNKRASVTADALKKT